MTVTATADYVAGGGVVERYTGTVSISLNIGEEDSFHEIKHELELALRVKAAKSLMYHPSLVTISNLQIK